MECEFEHPESNWYKLPKWVEDYPIDVLDVYAFRFLCHLARRDKGTRTDARELCERFGIAYDGTVWRRCSQQLRALGALEDVTVRCAGGRFRTVLRFRWPAKPASPPVEKQRAVSAPPPVENQRVVPLKINGPLSENKTGGPRRRIRGGAARPAGESSPEESVLVEGEGSRCASLDGGPVRPQPSAEEIAAQVARGYAWDAELMEFRRVKRRGLSEALLFEAGSVARQQVQKGRPASGPEVCSERRAAG